MNKSWLFCGVCLFVMGIVMIISLIFSPAPHEFRPDLSIVIAICFVGFLFCLDKAFGWSKR